MKTVSITHARNNFSELINQVNYGQDLILIEKMNKPVAALINIKEVNLNQLKMSINPPSTSAGTIRLPKKLGIKKVFEVIKEPYDRQSLFGR